MFIIPMAGNSSRFFKAGYTVPKYQLELWGRPMFDWVLKSFEKYYDDHFCFIVRKDLDVADFVAERCHKAGIAQFTIIELNHETLGQADTVRLGLMENTNDNGPIFIFNADSFHFDFTKPEINGFSGLLDVFIGEGEHWSFVEPDMEFDYKVKRTTEKERVSNLCSDGMYIFSSINIFLEAYRLGAERTLLKSNEIYIAPLYNDLIAQGMDISYRIIDSSKLYFCGTPNEYHELMTAGIPEFLK